MVGTILIDDGWNHFFQRDGTKYWSNDTRFDATEVKKIGDNSCESVCFALNGEEEILFCFLWPFHIGLPKA